MTEQELQERGFRKTEKRVGISRGTYFHRGRFFNPRTYLKDEHGTVWKAEGHICVPMFTRFKVTIKNGRIESAVPAQ